MHLFTFTLHIKLLRDALHRQSSSKRIIINHYKDHYKSVGMKMTSNNSIHVVPKQRGVYPLAQV